MKLFANISIEKIAVLLGIQMDGRNAVIKKDKNNTIRYLKNAIKTYLLLNFHANSNTGITGLLSVEKLAEQVSCTLRTIYQALRDLEDGGLLKVLQAPEYGYVVVQLTGLNEMYKRRGEGGKGYFTCSKELLQVFLRIEGIAILRTTLTAMIETVLATINSASKILSGVQVTMKTFQASFPASARPSDVKKACMENGIFGTLFSRTEPDLKRSIYVKLQEAYDAKQIKQEIQIKASRAISDEIDQINNAIRGANLGIHEDGMIHCHDTALLLKHRIDIWNFLDPMHHAAPLPLLNMTSADIYNCSVIAQDCGIDMIIDAIRIYYQNYLLSNSVDFTPDKNRSLGGLIRSIVQELFQSTPVAIN